MKCWRYDAGTREVVDENDIAIAQNVSPEDGPLLAAAPELREALREIIKFWDGEEGDMARAREAIISSNVVPAGILPRVS